MALAAVALAAASVALGAAQVDAWVSGVCRARRGTIVASIGGLAAAAVLFAASSERLDFAAAPLALLVFACVYVAGAARLVRRVASYNV